jgi:glycosyltransferase involved in cell wall biosynthesis
MKNIVWLTEWLPTQLDPYGGDGIERRAKAASLYNNIVIIYLKKKPGLGFKKIEPEQRIYNENCRAFIYFYPSIGKPGGLADLILSNYYFIRLHSRALYAYRKKNGKPSGIQVNVTMKNGIIACIYKWLWGVRYIVVEGWSLFLPEAKPQFNDKGWLFRFLTRRVLKHSSLLVAVSDHLAKMINQHIINVPYIDIPSVVDTNIFFPANNISGRSIFRFIHISSLDHPKNFEQLLLASKIVIEKGFKIELFVHGPDREEIKQFMQDNKIPDVVVFKKEAPQNQLAESMRSADALILYSRYETFGNVIIEANACGLPVIVSDYPTFNEIIIEGKTGLKAAGNNPSALAEKMIYMVTNYVSFDRSVIAAITKDKYNFQEVGKRFDAVYSKFF